MHHPGEKGISSTGSMPALTNPADNVSSEKFWQDEVSFFFLITFQWRWCAVPYMSAQATGILRALPTAASLLFSPWTVLWRCDLHWSVVVSNGPCLLQIPLPCQHSAHFPEYYISRLISFHCLSIDWDGDKFWTDMLFLSWFRIMRVLDINVYHMFYKR